MKSIFYINICFQLLMLFLSMDVFASNDPFASIQTELNSTVKSVVKIVQSLCVIGLVGYGIYSMSSGNLDKVRLMLIIVGLIIVSGAQMFVDFFATWVK